MDVNHAGVGTGLRRWLALIILAIGVRLLYAFSTSPDASIGSTDAWGYHQLAYNLDHGHGFSLRAEAPYMPDSVRTPLYPLFLLVVRRSVGTSPRTATIVQAFLDTGTMVLAGWLATHLGGHRAGRIAGVLYALNPTQVRYVNELLTETLLSFLLALAVCILIHYARTSRPVVPPGSAARAPLARATGWVLLLGLATGLAALCKPNVEFIALVWLLTIVWANWRRWRRAVLDSILLVLTVVAVLFPWVLRNRLMFGRWFLSTAFEANVSHVSAPATLATLQRRYVAPWTPDWEALFGQVIASAAAEYGWQKPWDALTVRETDQASHQVYLTARQILVKHPLACLLSHAQGMARYLEPQTFRVCYARLTGQPWPPDVLDDAAVLVLRALGSGDWSVAGQIISEERWHKLTPLQRTLWWGTLTGQLIGLGLLLRSVYRLRWQPVIAVSLLLTIGYVLWVPGPIAYERFRVPVMGLILALIGASASTATSAWKMPTTASAPGVSESCARLPAKMEEPPNAHHDHRTQRAVGAGLVGCVRSGGCYWHRPARA